MDVNQPPPEPEPESEPPEPEPELERFAGGTGARMQHEAWEATVLNQARLEREEEEPDEWSELDDPPEPEAEPSALSTGWAPDVHPGPVPPIERRAVSLEFLERLLDKLTPEMERSATAASIDFLERQAWATPAAAAPELPTLGADASNQDLADAIFDFIVGDQRDGRVGAEAMGTLRHWLGQPPLSDRAWARECQDVGGDPSVGLSRAQFAALFARPLATPAAALYLQLGQSMWAQRGYGARDLERRRREAYLSGRDVHKLVIKEKTHGLLCRYVELAGVADAIDADGLPSIGPADVCSSQRTAAFSHSSTHANHYHV